MLPNWKFSVSDLLIASCLLWITIPIARSAEASANYESTSILTSHCELSVADTLLADLFKIYQKPDQSLRDALNWVRCDGYHSRPSGVFDNVNGDPHFAGANAELQYKTLEDSFKSTRAIKVIPHGVVSLSTIGNVEACKDKACAATANFRELMVTF